MSHLNAPTLRGAVLVDRDIGLLAADLMWEGRTSKKDHFYCKSINIGIFPSGTVLNFNPLPPPWPHGFQLSKNTLLWTLTQTIFKFQHLHSPVASWLPILKKTRNILNFVPKKFQISTPSLPRGLMASNFKKEATLNFDPNNFQISTPSLPCGLMASNFQKTHEI